MEDILELTYYFKAPTEDIFDAWVQPELIRRWMYTGDNCNVIQVITNPVPNGEFCILKEDQEQELVDYCGTYHELARPNLLSFSLESPHRFTGTSSIIVRLHAETEGCRMEFLQTGIDPALLGPTWIKMFDRLAALPY